MFKYIILFSAIALAACAAWFSVTGIAQLFVGSTISAGIMAGVLEVSKLVGVSFLYRYWRDIPKTLRSYMLIGSITIMSVTSVGIYGYLSSAYAMSATEIQSKQNQIKLYNSQVVATEQHVKQLVDRSTQLQSMRLQQENRLDNLIKLNRSTVTQQRIIREQDMEISRLQKQISSLNFTKDSLQSIKTEVDNSIGTSGKLGTFYYVAQSLNISLDTIVKWFILVIVLVFDPMSISLFLAYNFIVVRELKRNQPTSDKNANNITQNRLNFTKLSENATQNDHPGTSRIDSDGLNPADPPTEPTDPVISVESIDASAPNYDNLPYYRRPGFEWLPGGQWETDSQAKAWRMEVG